MDLPVTVTGPTRQLADFASALRLADVDAVARHAARRHVIDTLACIINGAGQEATLSVQKALTAAGVGAGPVSMAGFAEQFDALSAAYLGGTAAHGLELDDGFRAGSVHPGAVVVPAALALAAQRGLTGAELLTAIIAGYEAACRIAAAAHPRSRWRGFHNTSTAGVFGAAVAAARLLGMSADDTEAAMGIAASSAAGIFTFLAGGDVKRIHPGHASREGLLAALLTEAGLPAPRGALEFKEGFFAAYAGGDTGEVDYSTIDILAAGDNNPNSRFAIANCYMKPHACCRHIHAAIDAVLDMAKADRIAAPDVDRVEIGTYAVAASHAEVGWSEMTTAQMSFPFVIATALTRNQVGVADFGDIERADGDTLALTGRIDVRVDEAYEAAYPRKRGAHVLIRTKDGRVAERHVPEPFGSASNPLTDEGLETKFMALAAPRLGEAKARRALELLWKLDELEDLAPLVEAMKR
jgi:2-methylcitrate dehydratase PrpD